jgi:hypothetical protein
MNRRSALKMLGFSTLAAFGAGGAWLLARKPKNPYYAGPVSDHFDGLKFYSPGRPDNAEKTRSDLLKWQFGGGKEAWPSAYPSPFADKPPAAVNDLRVTLVGHASYLVQTSGINILIDPVWVERASPFQFAGPKRVNTPGIAFDDLPRIDAVLVTHNHYDHMDAATLARLMTRFQPRLIVPLGNDALLRSVDKVFDKATAHDWGESVVLSDKVKVTLEPLHGALVQFRH